MNPPLVSVVTPTRHRPTFLEQCRRFVERQTYATRLIEWVIVDSSDYERKDMHSPIVAVRHLRAHGSIGHLRNIGARAASGRVIVHFDDDDWQSPTRIEKQVAALMAPGVELVCTDNYYCHFRGERPGAGRAAKSWSWGQDAFSSGGTFAFWKAAWERHPFPSLSHGEDQVFAKSIRLVTAGKTRNLRDPSLFCYVRHDRNTCVFRDDFEARCTPDDYAELTRLLGDDLHYYE